MVCRVQSLSEGLCTRAHGVAVGHSQLLSAAGHPALPRSRPERAGERQAFKYEKRGSRLCKQHKSLKTIERFDQQHPLLINRTLPGCHTAAPTRLRRSPSGAPLSSTLEAAASSGRIVMPTESRSRGDRPITTMRAHDNGSARQNGWSPSHMHSIPSGGPRPQGEGCASRRSSIRRPAGQSGAAHPFAGILCWLKTTTAHAKITPWALTGQWTQASLVRDRAACQRWADVEEGAGAAGRAAPQECHGQTTTEKRTRAERALRATSAVQCGRCPRRGQPMHSSGAPHSAAL